MMRIVYLFLLAALVSTASTGWSLSIYVVKNEDGTTTVVDPYNGNQYITRDPQKVVAWIYKRGRIEGFGPHLTQRQFQAKPATTAQAAVSEVRTVENAALRDANRVPGTTIFLRPIQRLMAALNSAMVPPARH